MNGAQRTLTFVDRETSIDKNFTTSFLKASVPFPLSSCFHLQVFATWRLVTVPAKRSSDGSSHAQRKESRAEHVANSLRRLWPCQPWALLTSIFRHLPPAHLGPSPADDLSWWPLTSDPVIMRTSTPEGHSFWASMQNVLAEFVLTALSAYLQQSNHRSPWRWMRQAEKSTGGGQEYKRKVQRTAWIASLLPVKMQEEPWTLGCWQSGKDKERGSPWHPPTREHHNLAETWFIPMRQVWAFKCPSCQRIHLYCFESSSLWSFWQQK